LDIAEVDLIVFFEAVASPIRLIQRMGRTGRKKAGRVVMLVNDSAEHEKLMTANKQAVSMCKMLRYATTTLQLCPYNPRMIPCDLKLPMLEMMDFEVQPDFHFSQLGGNNKMGRHSRATKEIDKMPAVDETSSGCCLHNGDSSSMPEPKKGKHSGMIKETVPRKQAVPVEPAVERVHLVEAPSVSCQTAVSRPPDQLAATIYNRVTSMITTFSAEKASILSSSMVVPKSTATHAEGILPGSDKPMNFASSSFDMLLAQVRQENDWPCHWECEYSLAQTIANSQRTRAKIFGNSAYTTLLNQLSVNKSSLGRESTYDSLTFFAAADPAADRQSTATKEPQSQSPHTTSNMVDLFESINAIRVSCNPPVPAPGKIPVYELTTTENTLYVASLPDTSERNFLANQRAPAYSLLNCHSSAGFSGQLRSAFGDVEPHEKGSVLSESKPRANEPLAGRNGFILSESLFDSDSEGEDKVPELVEISKQSTGGTGYSSADPASWGCCDTSAPKATSYGSDSASQAERFYERSSDNEDDKDDEDLDIVFERRIQPAAIVTSPSLRQVSSPLTDVLSGGQPLHADGCVSETLDVYSDNNGPADTESSVEGEDDNDFCAVCIRFESDPGDEIVYCDGLCGECVHWRCYGLSEFPTGDFYCDACTRLRYRLRNHNHSNGGLTNLLEQDDLRCFLCSNNKGLMKLSTCSRLTHPCCVLYCSELTVDEISMRPNNLCDMNTDRLQLQCIICKTTGRGVVQCAFGKCRISFHPYCAMRDGRLMLQRERGKHQAMIYEIFCHNHEHVVHMDCVTSYVGGTSSQTRPVTGATPAKRSEPHSKPVYGLESLEFSPIFDYDYESTLDGNEGAVDDVINTPLTADKPRKRVLGGNRARRRPPNRAKVEMTGVAQVSPAGPSANQARKIDRLHSSKPPLPSKKRRIEIRNRLFEDEAELSGSDSGDESTDIDHDVVQEMNISGSFINDGAYTQHGDTGAVTQNELYFRVNRALDDSGDGVGHLGFRGAEKGLPIIERLLRQERKRCVITKSKRRSRTQNNFCRDNDIVDSGFVSDNDSLDVLETTDANTVVDHDIISILDNTASTIGDWPSHHPRKDIGDPESVKSSSSNQQVCSSRQGCFEVMLDSDSDENW
jgi:hypothetical protein